MAEQWVDIRKESPFRSCQSEFDEISGSVIQEPNNSNSGSAAGTLRSFSRSATIPVAQILTRAQ
jgi:hypothetical protein